MHQIAGIALTVAAAISLVVSAPAPQSSAPQKCRDATLFTVGCVSGRVDGGVATLSARESIPGGGHRTVSPTQPHPTNTNPTNVAPVSPPDPARFCYRKKYGNGPHCTPTPKKPAPRNRGPITLADLKSFHPTPGSNHSQPTGWSLVGLDTNFYATTPTQTQHGTLLGKPADIRFTPTTWHWNYGDGTTTTTNTPGTTWAALHLPEFDPTPTSHQYQTRGTHTITLHIDFTADYRYAGTNWTPITGTITTPTPPLTTTTLTEKTVLVNHNCNQNPHGPGC